MNDCLKFSNIPGIVRSWADLVTTAMKRSTLIGSPLSGLPSALCYTHPVDRWLGGALGIRYVSIT